MCPEMLLKNIVIYKENERFQGIFEKRITMFDSLSLACNYK